MAEDLHSGPQGDIVCAGRAQTYQIKVRNNGGTTVKRDAGDRPGLIHLSALEKFPQAVMQVHAAAHYTAAAGFAPDQFTETRLAKLPGWVLNGIAVYAVLQAE